jgi:hypothetical protein
MSAKLEDIASRLEVKEHATWRENEPVQVVVLCLA